jgi:hypothetical protein
LRFRLETKTGAGFREGIYKVYGFDRSNQKFKAGPGFLSEITMEQAMVNATRVACDVLGDVMGRQVSRQPGTRGSARREIET